MTVAGLQGSSGVIENTEAESGVANGALIVNNTANYTFGGYLRNSATGSGSLSLTKNGSGVLTLVGANSGSYNGGLTVNAGTLDYSGGTLPECNFTITGGALNIGTLAQRIGPLRITGGTINGGGTLTSNVAYDVQAGTVNAVLAGYVGLTKTTAGVATVSSPTYSGTTNMQAGTLNFSGALPGGNYAISGGLLNIGTLAKTIAAFQITGGTVSGAGALSSSSVYDIQGGAVNAILAGPSTGLRKTGSGIAILTGADTYGGLTTVAGGTLDLGPAAQNAVFNLGGADVQAGRLAFDYNGAASPAAVIASLLSSSYHGGLWDLGQFHNSTAGVTGLTLGWIDDGSSKVTVMATYAGDFNVDGVVDGLDLNIWKTNFGVGTAWRLGDANYDGLVNGLDLDLFKSNFGLPPIVGGSSGGPASSASPSPARCRSWPQACLACWLSPGRSEPVVGWWSNVCCGSLLRVGHRFLGV